MSVNNEPLKIQKRLLQFNNLPIAYGEINEQSYTASFKGGPTPYTNYQHGGYYMHLGEYGVLNVANFDATLVFDFKKIECGDKTRYARFIKRQLAKSGKLWAVQHGGEIIWANARVVSINESVAIATENTIRLSVTFELIDGYWVYAWKTRTFLAPYCSTRFIDIDDQYCFDYQEGTCDITGSANRCMPCFDVLPEVNTDGDYKPLCAYSFAQITESLGQRCPEQYHIRYDCKLESDYFCYDASWGEKYKLTNKNPVNETTINYCAKTDLPTQMVQIRLRGNFVNPTIAVNDDTMTINGEYPNGFMVVVGFGVGVGLYKKQSGSVENWDYQSSLIQNTTVTNIPYFEINPGRNTIKITGNKQDKKSFAYVKTVDITY